MSKFQNFENEKNQTIVYYLFVFLVYASIILPSGNIFGLNIKLLIMVFFLFSLFYCKSTVLFKTVVEALPIFLFLLLFCLYSYLIFRFDSSYIIQQFKDILVFFIIFLLSKNYAQLRLGYQNLINIILIATLSLAFIKILILFYSMLTGLPVSAILKMISIFFGASIMGFDIEDAFFARINFASDSILPICIFYLTRDIVLKDADYKKIIFLSLIVFSSLLTMSRYQWLASIVAIILAFLLGLKSFKSLLAIFLIVFASLFALTLSSVQSIIQTRFDSKVNNVSDIERILQKEHIYNAIWNSPFFGNGMGYYIPEFVRSSENKYSYELQIPALIMQFGFIGFFILLCFIIYPILKPFRNLSPLYAICCFVILLMWIGGAMFNPIIFSSSSGLILVFIYCIVKSGK